MNNFVGRNTAVEQLKLVLTGQTTNGSLTIQPIEGPGGIGKTYLLDHVIENTNLDQRNYLTLKVTGNAEFPRTLSSCITELITRADGKLLNKKPAKHYFENTKKVIKELNSVVNDIKNGDAKQKLNIEPKKIGELIELILQTGGKLPPVIPGVDFKKLEHWYKELKPYIEQIPKLPLPIPDWIIPGETLRQLLRQDSRIPLSQALVTDLTTILHGYPSGVWYKPTVDKLVGIDRLLLIIDDYESLQYPMGDFLTQHFLPALAAAPFETLVVIICRDKLGVTSTTWPQQFQKYLQPSVVVSHLNRDEMDNLVEFYGYKTKEEKDRAWHDTEGYPYLVQLWIEEANAGGRTVGTLKMFYDRTTRWMNEYQKKWLEHVIFLNHVHTETLHKMLSTGDEPDVVMNWFENEGSIRDPNANVFKVREFIRSRLCEYIEKRDPKRHRELTERGKAAII
ncbi:MAG: hypothetical protein FIA89_00850 [Geobacter sp.]|nr:hypothetical protein [Geobacter sp.]